MSKDSSTSASDGLQRSLVHHFCRLQLPAIELTLSQSERHLQRTFELHRKKAGAATWQMYLEALYVLDWFVASACLEGQPAAWEHLFGARANRADFLLVDALRARALRLYPRDEERQENAVSEFWSHLLVAETAGSLPVLARYDGVRPLIPWLIRVFQNWNVSQLRHQSGLRPLPEDDLSMPLPEGADQRWHEVFCVAARACLEALSDSELLILGLRLRYRMSQREVAHLLGVHEGTISRQTTHLRDRLLERIERQLTKDGWAGDGLFDFVRQEMAPLLLDEPRLSAEHLATLLAERSKVLPKGRDAAPD
jgi:RNA polymerase sigma factor (sigma-70 family)